MTIFLLGVSLGIWLGGLAYWLGERSAIREHERITQAQSRKLKFDAMPDQWLKPRRLQ